MHNWLNQTESPIACAQVIVDSINEALVVINQNLEVVTANRAFYHIFSITRVKTENHNFFTLENIKWKSTELKRVISDLIFKNKPVEKYEVVQSRLNEERVLLLSATKIEEPGNAPIFLLVMEDVTGWARAEKKAESQLQESQLKLQKILDSNIVGIITANEHGELFEVNDYYLQLIGYTREEFNQKKIKWNEITPPQYLERDYEAVRQIIKYGRCNAYQKQYYRKDGTTIWILIGLVALRENQIIAYVVDISEQKKKEEELGKSESQLRAVFDTALEAIMILDQSGNIVLANNYQAELSGYKSAYEMINHHHYTKIEIEIFDFDGNIVPIEQWPVTKVLRGESMRDLELIIKKKGSKEANYFSISAEPIYDNTGKQILSLIISRDITDRIKNEMKLKESEELFRNLADNVSQQVWMADSSGRLFWCNKRWYEYTGKTLDQIRKGCRIIQDPEFYGRVMSNIRKAYEEGTPWEDTFPLIGKNGQKRWFLSRANPVNDDKGRIIRWIGTNTDITESRQWAEKLEQQKLTLEAILEFVPVGLVVVVPPDGKIIYSSRIDRIFTGTPAVDFGYDKDRIERIKARRPGIKDTDYKFTPLYRALQGKKISDEEWIVDAVTGGTYQVLVSAGPIRNKENSIIGAVLVWKDVTELVNQKKLLEKQKDELRVAEYMAQNGRRIAEQNSMIIEQEKRVLDILIKNVSTGIIVIDQGDEIKNISTYLSDMIGIPKQQLIGKHEDPVSWGLLEPSTLNPPEYQDLPMKRAMREKRGIYDVEYLLKKDGIVKTIVINADPVMDANGQVSGAVSAWKDITEIKRREKEKAYEAARYQAMFNSISDELLILDKDGRVKEANQSFLSYYSKFPEFKNVNINEPADFMTIYNELEQIIPFEKWPIKRVAEGEKIKNLQLKIKFKNGQYRYLLVSGSPVNVNHESTFSILTSHDITKQVETEKKLRTALEQWQRFSDANIIGIVIGTLDGNVTESNDYFLNLIGFTRIELKQGKINWKELSVTEFLEKDRDAVEQVNKNGKCTPYEKELFRKDGSRVWITIAVASIKVREIVAFILDITRLKNFERQLSDERNYISAILSVQGALVAVFDVNGSVLDLNPAFQEITGFNIMEIKGKSIWQFFPESDFKMVLEKYKNVNKTYEPVVVENWIQSKNGIKHFVSWRNAALKDDKGNITHIVATGIDITDRLNAEQKISELNSELKQHAINLENVNDELQSFSYSVSHDLKTPLSVILGFIGTVFDQYELLTDSELKKYLGIIEESAKKINVLINDILTLSQISRADLKLENINLSEVVLSVLDYLKSSEIQRLTEFTVQEGIVVWADRRLLHLSIENMLGNSWKYCSKNEKTIIKFGSFVSDGETVYYIKDNGVGFDMKHAEKIFQPFKRLHSDKEFKGSGIGLSTVQRVIRRHNGRVWAESQVGQGTAFYFTLNLHKKRKP